MKRFSEQFNKQANHIRLQASERSNLRERLVAYMEYHPLTAEAKSVSTATPLAGGAYRNVRIDLPIISKFIGAFAVLTLIIVPVFAENSIPGDILYPIKVSFNEEVRGSLTFSPYQKVEWETARLERRISEAQLLAEAGLLTPEVEAQVAQAVKGHSEAAQKEIANIGTTDMAEAALAKIALNTALEVQTEVLAKQLARDSEDANINGHSVSAIAAVIGQAKSNSDSNFDSASLPPDRLLAYIESETTRAYEYLDSVESVASVGERNDIRRRLNDINKTIDKAVDEEKQVTDAELLFSVVSDIRKLISFMTNIDVRENVSVEDLVPMVLTEEEHLALIEEKSTKLNELNTVVNSKLANIPESIKEKLNFSLFKVNELSKSTSDAVLAKDFVAAEASLNEALIIMIDLNSQTAGYQSEVIDENEITDETATSSQVQGTTTSTTTE